MWKRYGLLLLTFIGWQAFQDAVAPQRCTNCCVLDRVSPGAKAIPAVANPEVEWQWDEASQRPLPEMEK